MDDQPRAAQDVRIADIILPNQTNNFGNVFGGEVMVMMDRAAAVAALRYCRTPIVTASTERIDFRTPIHASEIIEIVARVIYVGHTSMIVRIHVFAEPALGGEQRLCTTGYFSMVTVRRDGVKCAVPPLALEDDASRDEWTIGEEIRRGIDARRGR